MTLKLDNSIPKDPYTKQLWEGFTLWSENPSPLTNCRCHHHLCSNLKSFQWGHFDFYQELILGHPEYNIFLMILKTLLLCVKIGTCLWVSGLDKLSDALIDKVTHCEQGETRTMGVACRYLNVFFCLDPELKVWILFLSARRRSIWLFFLYF